MSIHTCSYYCERPECIKAQRDELRQKLEQAKKQEPYGYFRYDIQLDAWVQNKESTQGVAFYTAPVHAIDMSQECVDETAKRKHEWVGLTEEELKTWKTVPIFEGVDPDQIRWIARKAEETLKEKNT